MSHFTFCVVNLGCKVNRVEADGFERLLEAAGGQAVAESDAVLIIVNTCTVTGEAEKKTRKAVRHALAANTNAAVVVTGCASELDTANFAAYNERVEVIPKAGMNLFLREWCEKYTTSKNATCAASQDSSAYVASQDDNAFATSENGECSTSQDIASTTLRGNARTTSLASPLRTHTTRCRVGLKVQDGCNHACTYCIVHVARGKASSVPAHEVFDQAYQLLNEGVQEIVLTGINLGTYESEGYTLASLCEEVLALSQGKTRVRIGSVEPLDVTDELMSVLARNEGKVCRHLHLPLQSGSTPVLYAMGRPYTAHEFVMLVERLRKKVPEMSLSTDIIVGFPGETEVDFNATCAMARACRFSKIHVFPYSPREGTPAALMPNQVDAATKAARAKTLRALSRELEQADCAARKGTTEWALVENNHRATTESYHDVAVGTHLDPGSWLTYTWE